MSDSFLAIVFMAAVLIVLWRLLLLVAAAILIAVVITGVGSVMHDVNLLERPGTSITVPAARPELPLQATPPR